MNKKKLSDNLDKIFDEKIIKIVIPKKFLIGLNDLFNRQNQQIKNILIDKNEKDDEYLFYLKTENEKIKELLIKLELAIRENKIEKIEIANFPKPQKIEFPKQKDIIIPEYPKEVNIKQPKWWKKFDYKQLFYNIKEDLINVTDNILNGIRNILSDHQTVDKALAVKLVDQDGKVFYNAVFSGGGGIDPVGLKDTQNTKINPAKEDGNLASLVKGSTTPIIYNIDLAIINTEYSQMLPTNTKKFTFQNRAGNDIRFAFETGKVAIPTAPYATLKAGMVYFEDNLNLTSQTLYFAGGNAGDDVELICWT